MDNRLKAYAREGARLRLAAIEREAEEIESLFPGIIKEQRRTRILARLEKAREARWAHKNASKKA